MIMLDPVQGRPETVIDKFKGLVTEKEQECTKSRKPFCRRCALLDFKDLVESTMKESERNQYETDINKFKIKMPDLEIYCKLDRFKVIGQKDSMERVSQVVAGQTVSKQVKYGIHKDFQCKIRGCRISIDIPDEKVN